MTVRRGVKSFDLPHGARQPLTGEGLADLVARICSEIVAQCGPHDAAVASVAIAKVIGELVRGCLGEAVATEILTGAVEHIREVELHLEVIATAPAETSDDSDPFTLPD